MDIKKVTLFILFLFIIVLFVPKTAKAIDLQGALTSENSILTKIQEEIEYFFAFNIENKIRVLDKQAEKRLTYAQKYAKEGNNEMVQNFVQNYLQIKEKQDGLLEKINNAEVLGMVTERTIEQQRTMEEVKIRVDKDTQQNMIQVQERVVNRVAERVVVTNGTDGQTEFFNKVEHVWAPGTGPGGGEARVVIEGGTMQFATGTSIGGPSGRDIKTVEVKTGGTVNEPVPVPNGPNYAPGTSGNSPGNTVDQGSVDPGNTGNNGTQTIDP